VEIRFQWIDSFMADAPPFADMHRLHQDYVDLEFLMEKIEKGEPALFLPGRIGRLAHRSEIDGSLQPYSFYIPEFYKGEAALPLFVTLHGSGVDETASAKSVAQSLLGQMMRGRAGRMFVLAPLGRGLSDWYVGDAGVEVLECIEHVQTLYPIDLERVILDGFSMGGYGAWRLGLLHPKLFKAVIIRSGAVEPPPGIDGENILDLMQPGIPNSYLVVHGVEDKAIPVRNARIAVKKMEELGLDIKYIELDDAAHGGYDRWDEIFDWLRDRVEWKDDLGGKPRRKRRQPGFPI
jgi:predicted peptidase